MKFPEVKKAIHQPNMLEKFSGIVSHKCRFLEQTQK